MRQFVLISSLLLVFYSCNKTNKIQQKVEKIMGQEIILPHDIQPTFDGKSMPNMDMTKADIKLVAWYDSLGCSPCRINAMYQWYDILNYADEIGPRLKVVFIFSPKNGEIIEPSLRSFRYPVYIDKNSEFNKLNPNLPQEESLHTFLLDKDDKIVMVGNPVQNEPLWNLYKEQIQLLLRN